MKSDTKNLGALIVLLSSILAYSFYSGAPQAGPVREEVGDKASFESITGESADEDKSVWDSFYRSKSHVFGKNPISFLKDYLHMIPKGKAFVPAMGEGRNAIYLAKKGFVVDGNDVSDVAMDKALQEAKTQRVVIKPIVADLTKFEIQENHYDFVLVSLFYMKNLNDKFKKAVKKGGWIMYYNRVAETDRKKQSTSPDDFSVNPAEVKEMLKDFKIKVFKEYTDQGIKVVGILAQKP